VVAELAELSPDFENVLAEFLSLLHHMSLAKTVPEALDEFVSAREELLKLSEEVSAEDLHLFYQIALIGRRDLPLSPDARNGFEMIMLRLLAFRPATVDAARVMQHQPQPKLQSQAAPSHAQPASPADRRRSTTSALTARLLHRLQHRYNQRKQQMPWRKTARQHRRLRPSHHRQYQMTGVRW